MSDRFKNIADGIKEIAAVVLISSLAGFCVISVVIGFATMVLTLRELFYR